MKHSVLILLLAESAAAASAQTAAKPAAPAAVAAKPVATAAKPAAAAPKPATAAASPLIAPVIKAPDNLPPVKGLKHTIFTVALRYQEIEIGKGPVAEPNKLYKVLYTGWRAADGVKFDSSMDHRTPVTDKDGKPVLGADGKPKLNDPQPMPFPQGVGGTIPGFDQGFVGMKVGGKRRIFIPWQMAYGTRNMPDHGPEHPGIPAKSDLIFDVQLVEVTDMPTMPANHSGMSGSGMSGMPTRPGMNGMPAGHPAMSGMPAGHPGTIQATPATPDATATPAKPAAPAAPTAPATPAAPTAPATTAAPAQPQSK